jgi:SET domain
MMEATSERHALVTVYVDERKGRHVVATAAIRAGTVATITGHREIAAANRFSVQVGADTHIDDLGVFTYLNHSCAPNVFLDTKALTLTAIRTIAKGDELSFFYPSTEWEMAEPFECHCGAAACVGVIAGAALLADDVLARYRVNQHIHEFCRNR